MPESGADSTVLAAIKTGRNRIGIETDHAHHRMTLRRPERKTRALFSGVEGSFTSAEEQEPYQGSVLTSAPKELG